MRAFWRSLYQVLWSFTRKLSRWSWGVLRKNPQLFFAIALFSIGAKVVVHLAAIGELCFVLGRPCSADGSMSSIRVA